MAANGTVVGRMFAIGIGLIGGSVLFDMLAGACRCVALGILRNMMRMIMQEMLNTAQRRQEGGERYRGDFLSGKVHGRTRGAQLLFN